MENNTPDFNFGIQDTKEYTGGSVLFSEADLEPIEEEQKAPEENKVESKKPQFDFNPGGSALFADDESTEEPDEKEITLPSLEKEPEVAAKEPENKEPEEETNQFESLANDLYELGIFTEIEGEEAPKTDEEFLAKWENEKKIAANQEINSFLSQFGKEYRDMFEAVFVKGIKPESYFHKTNTIESIKNMDLENDKDQERIVAAYYRQQNWPEDRIQKKIEKLKDYDDLKEEASTAQELLAKSEEESLKREAELNQAALIQKRQSEAIFQQTLGTKLTEKVKAKDFNGLPITDKIAKEVFDDMVTKKWTMPNTGEQLSDFDVFLMDLRKPENIETAMLIGLLRRNNFDFSKIKAKAVSTESNKIFKSVKHKETVEQRQAATKTSFSL